MKAEAGQVFEDPACGQRFTVLNVVEGDRPYVEVTYEDGRETMRYLGSFAALKYRRIEPTDFREAVAGDVRRYEADLRELANS